MQDVRYTQSLHKSENMLRSKLISWDFYHCLHNNIILDCGKNAREIGGWVVFRSVTWCAGRMTVESCVITLIMSGHNPLRAASLAMHCRDRNHNRHRQFDSFFKMFEKIDLSSVSIMTIPDSYFLYNFILRCCWQSWQLWCGLEVLWMILHNQANFTNTTHHITTVTVT